MSAFANRVVVMPAFRAERTLAATVARIPGGLFSAIVVCDDASPDQTAVVARQLKVELIRHERNRGYGGAQKSLYARALALQADVVVMLHPDNQYDAERLDAVVQALEGPAQLDFVLGSRIADGRAGERGMPWWKRGANRALTTLQNRVFGTRFTDLHTGLRAYRRETLARAPLDTFSDDFGFDAQMLSWLHAHGLRGGEVAVGSWYTPESSSVNLRQSLRYGVQVLESLARHRRKA